MGFIHSKNLRATARLIVLSVMGVMCHDYSLSIFVYTIIFSVLFFEIKKITVISLFFLEAPCIKWDVDTENILHVVN